ncbi:hypothetical protein GCM10011414_21010 [Croceivirga lutea]|uniref:heparinase II/III family protein n=1 Tax=Croceivirga lutea TaxID=1775167 RepID=UPI001639B1CF|nr:heparinase II/III family protein [Croceivirga lutea]GGG51242.1 hypothetical protein GCM10011414_21010 [Croceivirga lutea]
MKQLRLLITQLTLLFCIGLVGAQSLEHPVIYTTSSERAELLKTIETHSWAKAIVEELHQNIDTKLKVHATKPTEVLGNIPVFSSGRKKKGEQAASPLAAQHYALLKLASEAGMLYYLTQEEAYAQFAADILQVYIEELAPRSPQTTTITGNAFFDPRTTYPHIALTYDFIHPFLKKEGTKVYSISKEKYIPFDNGQAQKALKNIVGNVLQEYGKPDIHGKVVSNHPILTSPGALFTILCIEDDTERERLFNIFWEKGTAHQNSFKNTILPIFSEQGLWPESLSYGFMPIVSMNLNIIDRIKPELKVTEEAKYIFNGSFLYDYLRHPDRRFVRYGDSKRNNDFSANNYRYALHVAQRRRYTTIEQKAKLALQQAYEANGGYRPSMTSSGPYDQYQHLQLFWGVPIPKKQDEQLDFNKKTVVVTHAGVALERNYVPEKNELFGLCGIIGGAHYVHSHVTGISMELYGAGYVMAPNAGLPPTVPERQIPLHEHYFRLYAGNNTIVVNGTSHGLDEGSWKRRANVWQNTVANIAAEPKHLEEGIADEFSFATQFLEDTVNDATQERTLSTIRTSATTGYYLDVFRSKSNGENKFHDYIYHNIGDSAHILDSSSQELALQPTDRYQNDIGDVTKSPGWRYFEETETTKATDKAVKVRFDVKYDDRYMHLFVPNGVSRAYTKALAPPTREAKHGYVYKKTQVLAIRQEGEAWKRPFVAILEPSLNEASSVEKVNPLWDGDKLLGAIVVSKVGAIQITDYIISQEKKDALYHNTELDLLFEGRFGIVRTVNGLDQNEVILYIGEGARLQWQKNALEAANDRRGIERFKQID